jgi:hypothetical protein
MVFMAPGSFVVGHTTRCGVGTEKNIGRSGAGKTPAAGSFPIPFSG